MRAFIPLALAGAFCGCWADETHPSNPGDKVDPVIGVDGDDAEMKEAFQRARRELPDFWKTFEKHPRGVSGFSVKIPLREDGNVEYVWVGPLEKKEGRIYGDIGNEPQRVHSANLGDRVEIHADDVVDWFFLRNGKMVGNYTLRPWLKKMPREERERAESMLDVP